MTAAPFVAAGRLDAMSDTGLSNQDGITNDNTPTFTGTSAPGSVVQIFNGTNPATRQLIAWAVADSTGAWQATVVNPLADGLYANLVLQATASDGVTKATSALATVLVDTVGPHVTNVAFRRLNGQLGATFQDDRGGLNQGGVADRANFILTGSVLGSRRPRRFRIANATTSLQGSPKDVQVVNLAINNGRPIRAGKFRFTVRAGGIQDLAGNALDGEFSGRFPSGNSRPGGDFAAGLRPFRKVVTVPTAVGAGESSLLGPGGNRRAAPRPATGAVKTNAAKAHAHPAGPNQWARLANAGASRQ